MPDNPTEVIINWQVIKPLIIRIFSSTDTRTIPAYLQELVSLSLRKPSQKTDQRVNFGIAWVTIDFTISILMQNAFLYKVNLLIIAENPLDLEIDTGQSKIPVHKTKLSFSINSHNNKNVLV